MEKADLLESLRTLAEAVEMSCKIDVTDAGAVVHDILDNTKPDCMYETVSKIVEAASSYSERSSDALLEFLKVNNFVRGSGEIGAIVEGILDETDINCAYETVRKMVSAIAHHSDSAKMALAKCLKEDGWTDGQCDGAVLNLKAIDTDVPMGRVAQDLYSGLDQHQKELLLELASELIPLFLRDEDLHVNELSDIVDDSSLEEWASENGWKHPDHDSISDFVEDMGSSEVRDFVVEYIQDNL